MLALTLGTVSGGAGSFPANLQSAAAANLFYAALGGFIFNIANVLLLAGIESQAHLVGSKASRSPRAASLRV